MTTDDRQEFAKSLAACIAAYREEMDEAGGEGYWIVLSDLPLDRVKSAIFALMKTSKWLPKASEIREFVIEKMEHEAWNARREERISQDYAVCLASNIVREGRRNHLPDEDIRRVLELRGEMIELPLHWPGEEPWNKRAAGVPRVEFKRP